MQRLNSTMSRSEKEATQPLPSIGTVVSITGTGETGRIIGKAVSCGNLVAVIDILGGDRTVIAGAGQISPLPSGPRLAAVNGRTLSASRHTTTGVGSRAC